MSEHCRDLSAPAVEDFRPAVRVPIDRRRYLQAVVAGVGVWGMGAWRAAASLAQEVPGQEDPLQSPGASPSEGGAAEGAAGESETSEPLLRYEDPKVQRYRCGLLLDTGRATCRGIVSTFPVPREWPEQQVKLIEQSVDPVFASSMQVRELDGLVSQVVLRAAGLPANTNAEATFTFELTRSRIVAPESTAELKIPERAGRELRQYLISSPYIDPGSARIRGAVREIEAKLAEQGEAVSDWERVEAVYDWVREKVAYVEGDIKSADEALRDGTGDCEELTSVFVAICRAMRIPARMVHVLMHCYPEFYMEDAAGQGHWFPCQAAGTRQFGSMEEYRPILQKGDRFKTPEQSLQRYVAEFFKAAAVRGGKPKPRFVQEMLD